MGEAMNYIEMDPFYKMPDMDENDIVRASYKILESLSSQYNPRPMYQLASNGFSYWEKRI